jgi:hypothetical protein
MTTMTTTKTRSDLTLPVALAAMVPILLLRLGLVFVRFKVKRRGSVRRFRRALVRGGMDRDAAGRLAAEYESYGRLRTYLPEGTGLRLPFRF